MEGLKDEFNANVMRKHLKESVLSKSYITDEMQKACIDAAKAGRGCVYIDISYEIQRKELDELCDEFKELGFHLCAGSHQHLMCVIWSD
jgi:hypothetical protein